MPSKGRESYVWYAEDVVRIPDLGHGPLRDDNQVEHQAHEGPAGNDKEDALGATGLLLLGGAQLVDKLLVDALERKVGLYPRRQLDGGGVGEEQRPCQRQDDEAGEDEDEEGVELGLRCANVSVCISVFAGAASRRSSRVEAVRELGLTWSS